MFTYNSYHCALSTRCPHHCKMYILTIPVGLTVLLAVQATASILRAPTFHRPNQNLFQDPFLPVPEVVYPPLPLLDVGLPPLPLLDVGLPPRPLLDVGIPRPLLDVAHPHVPILEDDSGCWGDGKVFVKSGDQFDVPETCFLNVCRGKNEWTQGVCPFSETPPGWIFVAEDPALPYPDCCEHAIPPLEIVPDILDKFPGKISLDISYSKRLKCDLGNVLTPTQVKLVPKVEFDAEPEAFYTLIMTDPDAPSRREPSLKEFVHWLVGNIPGGHVTAGEPIYDYIGAGPPSGTGLHRYIFVLYRQPGLIRFDEPRISNTSIENRSRFSVRRFANKYHLGDPLAVNAFQARFDDFVPILHAQIGFQ